MTESISILQTHNILDILHFFRIFHHAVLLRNSPFPNFPPLHFRSINQINKFIVICQLQGCAAFSFFPAFAVARRWREQLAPLKLRPYGAIQMCLLLLLLLLLLLSRSFAMAGTDEPSISRVWQNQVAKSGPSEIVSWKVALTLARATVDVPW